MSFSVFVATQTWAQTSGVACQSAPEVSSTNDWAKDRAFSPGQADFEVCLADHQTQGRGRGSHSWSDFSSGDQLLSSWSFRLQSPPQPVTSPAMGLAVFRAAVATWPDLPWSLKAPNDLFCQGAKVAGLLIESIQQGEQTRLIVGLGLNVFSKPDIPQAGCLRDFLNEETIDELTWSLFLDRLWLEMVACLRETRSTLSANQCRSLKYALNRNPQLLSPFAGITPEGSLILPQGQRIEWQSL